VAYWEKLLSHSFKKYEKIIMGGDLNFIVKREEIHGNEIRVDPLEYFFLKKIEEDVLGDVEPIKLVPTWRNMRTRIG